MEKHLMQCQNFPN